MRRFICILAAILVPAVYAAEADDAFDRERSQDDSALFRGSSAQPPGDVFLAKRDRTSELAGVSVLLLPEMPGLGGGDGGVEARQQQRCCPAGSQCAAQAGYCRRLVLTKTTTQITTTRTRTTQSTQTSTSTRIVESSKTSSRAITVSESISVSTSKSTRTTVVSSSRVTSTAKTSETACAVDGVARRGDQHDPTLQRRQNLRPNCVYECHNGQTLPVVEVPNIPGQTDQLFFSMCSGILATGSGRGGDGRNFDILTYKGADGKALRRSQARCKGYCAVQRAIFNDPASLQCDEYPPAMAGEGGAGAFKVCIPNSQNSGAQGKLFRRFVSDCAPAKGTQFVVRMNGGCNVRNDKRSPASFPPQQLATRAEENENRFNASSNVLYSWDNMTYMYVPLPALQNGHYRIEMRLGSGSEVRGVQVTDSDGEDHYASNAAVQSGQHVVEFDITDVDVDAGEEGDELPAGLFLDVDEAVEVSYQANATLNGTAQSGNESKGSRTVGWGFVSWWLLVAAAVMM
ncbi:hypothetical protein LEL_04426 [Akanthomyces lecanii RCEF 1005]|uniref:Deoxyribonuclease NucA/NucB domain-containing protein n=1 Tax=Akanthomyces lecanii RCEF 1005 TaxID=1081108 RepID=A0A162K6G9_CORDF|nr:hypothetical protein LEL_04426 [Akanthomyces lecanii RCEF 1005]